MSVHCELRMTRVKRTAPPWLLAAEYYNALIKYPKKEDSVYKDFVSSYRFPPRDLSEAFNIDHCRVTRTAKPTSEITVSSPL